MIQKDYIMRMLRQLAEFLAKVLFNKNAGDHEKALSLIESACGSILGIDFGLLESLSAHDIAELLGISKDKSTGSMKCIIAARLLKEKAEILRISEKDGSVAASYHRKALSLYLQGALTMGYTEMDMTGYYEDIDHIADALGNVLPDDVMFMMFSLYRKLGEYDKAEDWLFRLKEAKYPDVLNTGTEFYRELAKTGETKLRNGNMTRGEIEEGLADFIGGKPKGEKRER
jgi:tetratricopeptide (TPR) repeat protein